MLIVWKDDKRETYLQEKTIAQEINLERVISEEMPRILSPVILVRDIDPLFTDWFRPFMDTCTN